MVTSFEPVSTFGHFASADPTGKAGLASLASLFAEPDEGSTVFYYLPESTDANGFILKGEDDSTILNGANLSEITSDYDPDYWYIVGSTVEESVDAEGNPTAISDRFPRTMFIF